MLQETFIAAFILHMRTALLYGLQGFSVAKCKLSSLDFAVARILMKLFRSINVNVVNECRSIFNFTLCR